MTAEESGDVESSALAVPLHVLDCTGLPAHTCVWGGLQQSLSVLASLLPQAPSKPHAATIAV
jgi:hypothetical protein